MARSFRRDPCLLFGQPPSVSTPWVKVLFWIYLLFLVWAYGTVSNPADPDLWHRLAVGDYLWHNHHFPLGDTFSYLPDYKFVADHEWGSAVIFYALWQLGHGTAMVVTKLLTLTITLVLVVSAGFQGRRPTVIFAAFYALVLWALHPSFASTVRCMVFTNMFFALWLYWYQRERHGHPVPTLFYVLTMIVWANLHGGFVVGLLWLFMLCALDICLQGPWKKWAVRLGLCSLATLINPFGWDLWLATGRALVATRRGFDEWAPVNWWTLEPSYPGYKLLLLGVLGALAIQVYRRGWKYIDPSSIILLGVFMVLALISARHTPLFALVAGALVPDFFPLKWPHILVIGPVRRLVVMAMSSGLMLFPLYAGLWLLHEDKGLELEYPHVACPVGAVDYLEQQNIRGNILVPFNYGSYALWKLRGRMRVSMDGRYDLVYKPETYRRQDEFFNGPHKTGPSSGWGDLLTNPVPDAILIPHSAFNYHHLERDPDHWIEAWQDSWDSIFLPVKATPR